MQGGNDDENDAKIMQSIPNDGIVSLYIATLIWLSTVILLIASS